MRPWWRSLLVAMVAVPGCSCVFVQTPRPREGITRCTRGTGAPVVDTLVAVPATVIGVFAGITYLSGFGAAGHESNAQGPAGKVAAISLPIGVLYSLGAIYGFRATTRCRRASAPIPAPGSAGGQ